LLETIKPEENQQWDFRKTESIILIRSQTFNLSCCKLNPVTLISQPHLGWRDRTNRVTPEKQRCALSVWTSKHRLCV